jgi:hypothetical protein
MVRSLRRYRRLRRSRVRGPSALADRRRPDRHGVTRPIPREPATASPQNQRALHLKEHRCRRRWRHQKQICTGRACVLAIVGADVSRQHDDRRGIVDSQTNVTDKRGAFNTTLCKHDVSDDNVGQAARQHAECILGPRGAEHRVPAISQYIDVQLTPLVTINEQNSSSFHRGARNLPDGLRKRKVWGLLPCDE